MGRSKNSGYICRIDTGGVAVAKHAEQQPEFAKQKKHFVHFLNDDFTPVMIDGKEKTGLIDSERLKIFGMQD